MRVAMLPEEQGSVPLPADNAVIGMAPIFVLCGDEASNHVEPPDPCRRNPTACPFFKSLPQNAGLPNAEEALASKKADAERASLICLITAVRFLEAVHPIVTDGPDRHELLRVPRVSGGPGKP